MILKFIMFGDVVGRIGRKALTQAVPKLRKKYKPDLVIANAENLAHGKGVTAGTLREVIAAGVNFFTGGNHILDNKAGLKVFDDPEFKDIIIRPANYPGKVPGSGIKFVQLGAKKILMVSLNGQVFVREGFDSPFLALDRIVHRTAKEKAIIVVDFHAEATSEKVAFGYYADGRVSAVLGTHTHVPTADAKILPKGTGYISDIGMVGEEGSIIGVKREVIINNFVTQIPQMHEYAEHGPCEVSAVYFEIDPKTKKTTKIKQLQQIIQVA
ncbi:TIGR00282 family metallophosphoesterase [Patescibacteria group bacterium]|nr:TIGR00282 family metallophosphoesterase [Patescibacteria group bacterium]MBU1922478.1 TIGR00282 family metallophosphoesterase [Patescibacteria group bacterium]